MRSGEGGGDFDTFFCGSLRVLCCCEILRNILPDSVISLHCCSFLPCSFVSSSCSHVASLTDALLAHHAIFCWGRKDCVVIQKSVCEGVGASTHALYPQKGGGDWVRGDRKSNLTLFRRGYFFRI